MMEPVALSLALTSFFFPLPLLVAAMPIFSSRDFDHAADLAAVAIGLAVLSFGSRWTSVGIIVFSWDDHGDIDRVVVKWSSVVLAAVATVIIPWASLSFWTKTGLIDMLLAKYHQRPALPRA
jgi:hypothetical protein